MARRGADKFAGESRGRLFASRELDWREIGSAAVGVLRVALFSAAFGAGAALILERVATGPQPTVGRSAPSASTVAPAAPGRPAALGRPATLGGPAAPSTAPKQAVATKDGARRWSDLGPAQQISVFLAFLTVLAVALGAATLARQRAEARWQAAHERRHSSGGAATAQRETGRAAAQHGATSVRRSAATHVGSERAHARDRRVTHNSVTHQDACRKHPSTPPQQSPQEAPLQAAPAPKLRKEDAPIEFEAYLRELGVANGAMEAAEGRAGHDGAMAAAWRTAHERRRRRLEHLRELASEKTSRLQAREAELRLRLAKFGRAETARRKSAERGGGDRFFP
ncbi:MAG: hypothetical protein MRY74_06745 [Neomegalonema sp.]|nr:hypothetical protein [Neomegalonema sp.]